MRLTKDGEKVLEEARKILEATEKISSMKGGSPRLTGNLGIAVDETLLQYRDFSQVCERSSQWCELRYSQVQTAH